MYAYLPLMTPVAVRASLLFAFAMPKSTSFTTPENAIMMLCGLTSR